MDNRIFAPLAALALLLGVTIVMVAKGEAIPLLISRAEASALQAGSQAPPLWKPENDSEVVIGWIFRAEDCFACDAPTEIFRSLQRQFGNEIKIVATVVGPDVEGIEQRLRRERVDHSLTQMTENEYRSLVGSAPLPAIYLTRGETVRYSLAPYSESDFESLEQIIGELVEGRGSEAASTVGKNFFSR